jgi:hypothetical protein
VVEEGRPSVAGGGTWYQRIGGYLGMLSRKVPIESLIPILIFRGVRWSVLEHTIVEGRHGLHLCSCFVVGGRTL